MYAKVRNNIVIKYPYVLEDLRHEVNDMSLDDNNKLFEYYSFFNLNKDGSSLVEVEILPVGPFDSTLQTMEKEELPVFREGKWSIGFIITDKSQETIDYETQMKQELGLI